MKIIRIIVIEILILIPTFQSGSYYLSEYAFSSIAGNGVNYETYNVFILQQ
ncbi:hypothetical protein QWY99_11895 [Flavobacterium branchiarum]|uniref:hypothetical protein n=1 Tax=Flavobacterium branchiarum TaxID=1114870 RepID=UPI0025B2E36E|nr:hypothetical protein [Flavobacterium branchiarum]MDN3673756.1 hypothetical protein [Flavobacterium branchiarum]